MKEFKLKRPIPNAKGDGELTKVTFKDEKDVSASDFYEVSFSADGSSQLGSVAGTIANLAGLTDEQVALLHPRDYIAMSAEVSGFLE